MASHFGQDPKRARPRNDPLLASAERSRARRTAERRRRYWLRRAGALALLLAAIAGVIALVSSLSGTRTTRAAGTGGPGDATGGHPGPGQGTPGPGWLVATQGPQPTIAAENSHSGTGDWSLGGPASDVGGLAHGSVAGYVSAPAVMPGHTERIYVNAPGAGSVRIQIFRIGWYHGAGGREVLASGRLPAVAQPPCAHSTATGLTQCNWHPTLTFQVPTGLASGVYIAKLITDHGASDCLFVVQAARPQPLLAQLPTSTYQAYNAWGGDSLYPGGSARVGATGTTQGVAVSYDRPYESVTGAGQFFARDVAMVWFLERYGYPVSYTTSESVDDHPEQLAGHRALIDFGHSEYWSARQQDAWASALNTGTSLLFFGSDTLAWRVRYDRASAASSESGAPGHVIVAYKEHAAQDPNTSTPTGAFPGWGAGLTGSAYLGCITPRLTQPGPPTYRYYRWTPAPGLQPAWLFDHTGITQTTAISGIVGYELDQRTPLSPPGTRLVGAGVAPCMSHRPEPGEPVPGPGDDRAETTIYTASSGAIVFNTGTLGWELGLEPVPSASPDAPRSPSPYVVAITRNLLGHVLGSPSAGA